LLQISKDGMNNYLTKDSLGANNYALKISNRFYFAEGSFSFEIVSAEVEVAFLGITRSYLKITRAVFERERAAYRSN